MIPYLFEQVFGFKDMLQEAIDNGIEIHAYKFVKFERDPTGLSMQVDYLSKEEFYEIMKFGINGINVVMKHEIMKSCWKKHGFHNPWPEDLRKNAAAWNMYRDLMLEVYPGFGIEDGDYYFVFIGEESYIVRTNPEEIVESK